MLHLWIVSEKYQSLLAFVGILFAFVATVAATAKLSDYLPKDAGREFAHDGKKSAGKPRGAGIIFVLAFAVAAVLCTYERRADYLSAVDYYLYDDGLSG